jgi:hypothetical protein
MEELYYGASLAKIAVDFYEKWKRPPTETEVSAMKLEAQQAAQDTIAKLPSDTPGAQSVIETLERQITKYDEDLNKALAEPDLYMAEMTKWSGNLLRDYCGRINETRKFNGGQLPDSLIPLWNMRCCVDGKPRYRF